LIPTKSSSYFWRELVHIWRELCRTPETTGDILAGTFITVGWMVDGMAGGWAGWRLMADGGWFYDTDTVVADRPLIALDASLQLPTER